MNRATTICLTLGAAASLSAAGLAVGHFDAERELRRAACGRETLAAKRTVWIEPPQRQEFGYIAAVCGNGTTAIVNVSVENSMFRNPAILAKEAVDLPPCRAKAIRINTQENRSPSGTIDVAVTCRDDRIERRSFGFGLGERSPVATGKNDQR